MKKKESSNVKQIKQRLEIKPMLETQKNQSTNSKKQNKMNDQYKKRNSTQNQEKGNFLYTDTKLDQVQIQDKEQIYKKMMTDIKDSLEVVKDYEQKIIKMQQNANPENFNSPYQQKNQQANFKKQGQIIENSQINESLATESNSENFEKMNNSFSNEQKNTKNKLMQKSLTLAYNREKYYNQKDIIQQQALNKTQDTQTSSNANFNDQNTKQFTGSKTDREEQVFMQSQENSINKIVNQQISYQQIPNEILLQSKSLRIVQSENKAQKNQEAQKKNNRNWSQEEKMLKHNQIIDMNEYMRNLQSTASISYLETETKLNTDIEPVLIQSMKDEENFSPSRESFQRLPLWTPKFYTFLYNNLDDQGRIKLQAINKGLKTGDKSARKKFSGMLYDLLKSGKFKSSNTILQLLRMDKEFKYRQEQNIKNSQFNKSFCQKQKDNKESLLSERDIEILKKHFWRSQQKKKESARTDFNQRKSINEFNKDPDEIFNKPRQMRTASIITQDFADKKRNSESDLKKIIQKEKERKALIKFNLDLALIKKLVQMGRNPIIYLVEFLGEMLFKYSKIREIYSKQKFILMYKEILKMNPTQEQKSWFGKLYQESFQPQKFVDSYKANQNIFRQDLGKISSFKEVRLKIDRVKNEFLATLGKQVEDQLVSRTGKDAQGRRFMAQSIIKTFENLIEEKLESFKNQQRVKKPKNIKLKLQQNKNTNSSQAILNLHKMHKFYSNKIDLKQKENNIYRQAIWNNEIFGENITFDQSFLETVNYNEKIDYEINSPTQQQNFKKYLLNDMKDLNEKEQNYVSQSINLDIVWKMAHIGGNAFLVFIDFLGDPYNKITIIQKRYQDIQVSILQKKLVQVPKFQIQQNYLEYFSPCEETQQNFEEAQKLLIPLVRSQKTFFSKNDYLVLKAILLLFGYKVPPNQSIICYTSIEKLAQLKIKTGEQGKITQDQENMKERQLRVNKSNNNDLCQIFGEIFGQETYQSNVKTIQLLMILLQEVGNHLNLVVKGS